MSIPQSTMRTWDLPIPLDPDDDAPLYLQLSQGIIARVERGALRPGDALPGTRALAEHLQVHRNTVMAAYRELASQGWIQTRIGGGTYIVDAPPIQGGRPVKQELSPPPPPHGSPALTGLPDGRLLPTEAFAKAYHHALEAARHGHAAEDPQGHPHLRRVLGEVLGYTRGLETAPGSLLLTQGAPAAIGLVAEALLQPGDAVAVEEMGQPALWAILRRAGVELLPVPIDGEGVDVEALEALAEMRTLRAVYVTPMNQYPTTGALSPSRRERLLRLAESRGFFVIEHDHDAEFHFDLRAAPPLAAERTGARVIHVGTLSKLFAPGMRLGFLHTAPDLVACAAAHRAQFSQTGDPVLELAVADLIESGELQRHLNRARRVYQSRRDLLVEVLRERLSDCVRLKPPSRGLAMWLELEPRFDAQRWASEAQAWGLGLRAGGEFCFAPRTCPGARLAFSALEEGTIPWVGERLATALMAQHG